MAKLCAALTQLCGFFFGGRQAHARTSSRNVPETLLCESGGATSVAEQG
eukprot:CAMPEP_0115132252 /NCGR_PEP_ID=MMETSP0227-20121206/53625_1 /TAXON_ID=89957 /ORGANISM="Polarella glacialis, Strain CCMP 1383" /LENGTH=48 /DNA_ID= /DNA_START= /DNA_END= /DNA_ORIENTATION=